MSRGIRSPLNWQGSKRWLVPLMRKLYAPYRDAMFVEMFAGGASLTFGLLPSKAWLNDINPALVNFYRWLQRGLKLVHITPECSERRFYAYRKRLHELLRNGMGHTMEAAELFYWLSKYSFGGGISRVHGGLPNPSFGGCGERKRGKATWDLTHYAPLMKGYIITNLDFRQMQIPGGAFVYADPPYWDVDTSYGKYDFSWQDHVDLASKLSEHDGPVVISNQGTPEVAELYGDYGFKVTILPVYRNLGTVKGRKAYQPEVLATKNIPLGQDTPQV